jgi:hypothetical protein
LLLLADRRERVERVLFEGVWRDIPHGSTPEGEYTAMILVVMLVVVEREEALRGWVIVKDRAEG